MTEQAIDPEIDMKDSTIFAIQRNAGFAHQSRLRVGDEAAQGADSGWKRLTLGDLGTITGGGTPSTKTPEYWEGGIPWLTPSEVGKSHNMYLSSTQRTISSAGLQNSGASLLPPSSVLITSRATIGEVVINTVPMATNQGFINVVCNPDLVTPEFLAFWIRLNEPVLISRAAGSTFLEISKSSFRTVPISLPPLHDQRLIVEVLGAIETASEMRHRELALERERKAALMDHLFTYGTRGEAIKQTEIGDMPESWRVVRIRDVATLMSGGTPSKARADWWQGIIPWVSPKDLKRPRLRDVPDHISEEAAESGSRIAPAGTVFIVVRGMILAKDAPVALAERSMAFNQDLKAIVPSSDLLGAFLLNALSRRKDDLKRIIGTSAHGTRRIGTGDIEDFVVPLPPREEQRALVAALLACELKIEALEGEILQLGALFDATLDELMCGRLSANS